MCVCIACFPHTSRSQIVDKLTIWRTNSESVFRALSWRYCYVCRPAFYAFFHPPALRVQQGMPIPGKWLHCVHIVCCFRVCFFVHDAYLCICSGFVRHSSEWTSECCLDKIRPFQFFFSSVFCRFGFLIRDCCRRSRMYVIYVVDVFIQREENYSKARNRCCSARV